MIVDMVRHFVTFQFLFQELQFCGISSNMLPYEEAQWPHSHILMTGGGGWGVGVGPSDFLGLKFWPTVIFWIYERRWNFFGWQKNQRDISRLRKKDQGIFLGMLKTVVIFLGRKIPKL